MQPAEEPAAVANPERDAIGRQQHERLWTAIRELPLHYRQIMVLYLEGFSAAEIEAVTGVSQGNVATRLTRMRPSAMSNDSVLVLATKVLLANVRSALCRRRLEKACRRQAEP